MNYPQALLYLDGLKAFAGISFCLVALVIYWKIKNEKEVAMSSFQLNEKEIEKDAKIILYANIFMASAMIVYILAGLEMLPLLLGNVMRTVYIAVIGYVLVRWVKMFR